MKKYIRHLALLCLVFIILACSHCQNTNNNYIIDNFKLNVSEGQILIGSEYIMYNGMINDSVFSISTKWHDNYYYSTNKKTFNVYGNVLGYDIEIYSFYIIELTPQYIKLKTISVKKVKK